MGAKSLLPLPIRLFSFFDQTQEEERGAVRAPAEAQWGWEWHGWPPCDGLWRCGSALYIRG